MMDAVVNVPVMILIVAAQLINPCNFIFPSTVSISVLIKEVTVNNGALGSIHNIFLTASTTPGIMGTLIR